jgi:hypothetical protein
MNSLIYRARQASLALLVVAVVDHGHVQTDYSGSTPQSWGLLRLGRDIMRRAGSSPDGQGVEGVGVGVGMGMGASAGADSSTGAAGGVSRSTGMDPVSA